MIERQKTWGCIWHNGFYITPTHTANIKYVHKQVCICDDDDVTHSVLRLETVFALCTLHWIILYTRSPGTAPVPKMQINIFTRGGEAGGEGGGGGPMCSAGHTDITGHDGCCQCCCLATQDPSRQPSSLASAQWQTGLVQHGTGHRKIITWGWVLGFFFVFWFFFLFYIFGNHSWWFPEEINISKSSLSPTWNESWKNPRVFELPPTLLGRVVEFYWLVSWQSPHRWPSPLQSQSDSPAYPQSCLSALSWVTVFSAFFFLKLKHLTF